MAPNVMIFQIALVNHYMLKLVVWVTTSGPNVPFWFLNRFSIGAVL